MTQRHDNIRVDGRIDGAGDGIIPRTPEVVVHEDDLRDRQLDRNTRIVVRSVSRPK